MRKRFSFHVRRLKRFSCHSCGVSYTHRGPSVLGVMKSNKKPQLGWRDPLIAETILFPALFKFAYHEEMHKINHGEKTAKWD